MSICRKCEKTYEKTPFQIMRGRLVCRDCLNEERRAYNAKRKAEGRPLPSGPVSPEQQSIYGAEYTRRPEVRARRAAKARERLLDPVERQKAETRWATRRAVANGTLSKGSCEVCGSQKVEAHHDDYSSPLLVRWLCRRHHTDLHHPKFSLAEEKQ